MTPAAPRSSDIRVFFSYARDDGAAILPIKAYLEGDGFDVMIDSEDILPGELWKDRLARLVDQSDVVVFFLTPGSLASAYCAWEVEHATARSKRILAVAIRDPGEAVIPAALQQIQWLFLRNREETAANLTKLAAALRTDVKWLRYQTGLLRRANLWADHGKVETELLAGPALQDAERFLLQPPKAAPPPADLVQAYVRASLEAAQARQRAELEAAESRAEEERRLRRNAESRQLSAQSQTLARQQPDLAGLIAIAAWRRAPTDLARTALLARAVALPRLQTMLRPVDPYVEPGAKAFCPQAVAFSADGRCLAHIVRPDGTGIDLWSLGEALRWRGSLGDDPGLGDFVAIALNGDATSLLGLTSAGYLLDFSIAADWHARTRAVTKVADEPYYYGALAVEPGASRVFVGWQNRISLYDIGSRVHEVVGRSEDLTNIKEAHWLTGSQRVLFSGLATEKPRSAPAQSALRSALFDLATRRILRCDAGAARPFARGHAYLRNGDGDKVYWLHPDRGDAEPVPYQRDLRAPGLWALHGSGEELAYHDKDQILTRPVARDAIGPYVPPFEDTGRLVHSGWVDCLVAAPPAAPVGYASAALDGSVAVWSKARRHRLARRLAAPSPAGEDDMARSLHFSADSKELARIGCSGALLLWDLAGGQATSYDLPPLRTINHVAGRWIAVTGGNEVVAVTGPQALGARHIGEALAVRPSERGFFVLGDDFNIWIRDSLSGEDRAIGSIAADLAGRWQAGEPHARKLDGALRRRRLVAAADQRDIFVYGFGDRLVLDWKIETKLADPNVYLIEDGAKLLVAGCEAVQLWDLEARDLHSEYGSGSGVGAPWFADADPTGHFFVAKGYYGGGFAIFETRSTLRVAGLAALGETDSCAALKFSPCGELLAADDGVGGILLLPFGPETWCRRIAEAAGRDLTDRERRVYVHFS